MAERLVPAIESRLARARKRLEALLERDDPQVEHTVESSVSDDEHPSR